MARDRSMNEGTPLLSNARQRDDANEAAHALTSSDKPSGTSKLRSATVLASAMRRARNQRQMTGIADVIAELEKDQKQNNVWLGFAFFSIVNHFLGGIVTMHILEGWSLVDAAYFCVVVTTTVGYGDMAPAHVAGKLYTCYFTVASVALISTMLAYFVGLLIDKQEALIMEQLVGGDSSRDVEAAETRRDGASFLLDASSMSMWSWARSQVTWLSDYVNVLYTAMFLIGVCIVGVFTFMHFENLRFVDALYVTIISATTVGFGDVEPTTWQTKAILTLWLLVATLTVAKLVTDQSDAFVRSKQRSVARRLLSANMDTRSLHTMDADGDGKVTRSEFLVTCLTKLGKVDEEEVNEILRRFDELDHDKSGVIDMNECSNYTAM